MSGSDGRGWPLLRTEVVALRCRRSRSPRGQRAQKQPLALKDKPAQIGANSIFFAPGTALLPILDLLDRIRGGYFQLVCVLPPDATWTSQFRSRSCPFGLEGPDREAAQQVFHANACCERSAWISEQAAICSQCRLILAFSEDLGFMAPVCKFMTIHPRHSVQAAPLYAAVFLRFLAGHVEQRRHCPCAVQTFPSSAAPSVDAQASAERTGIGGWLPSVRPGGSLDLWSSRWFSLELKRKSWPWVNEKSDKPSLLISTLEALAVLFSLMLFFDDILPQPRTKV